jgi:hypothetical protein
MITKTAEIQLSLNSKIVAACILLQALACVHECMLGQQDVHTFSGTKRRRVVMMRAAKVEKLHMTVYTSISSYPASADDICSRTINTDIVKIVASQTSMHASVRACTTMILYVPPLCPGVKRCMRRLASAVLLWLHMIH